jgi:hypothetical protein
MPHDLKIEDLSQFYGSENWYRHGINRRVLYTDGVRYVAEHGGAFWLVDEIAIRQSIAAVRAELFQSWKLKVNATDRTALLTCDNGNGRIVHTYVVPYTDFPLDEIVLWFSNDTILLPDEY